MNVLARQILLCRLTYMPGFALPWICKLKKIKKEDTDMQNKKRVIDKKRVFFLLAMAVLGVMMFMIPAFATDASTTASASTVMTNLINLMCSMFKYVGAAIFVWAIIQFVLATKRSDADSKADAIQTAVCGIALMGIAGIINGLGIGKAIDSDSETPGFTDDTFASK